MSKPSYLNNGINEENNKLYVMLINEIEDLYTSENSFLVTAKKVPNSDSPIITTGCQFVIRWAETTRPKKKTSYI